MLEQYWNEVVEAAKAYPPQPRAVKCVAVEAVRAANPFATRW